MLEQVAFARLTIEPKLAELAAAHLSPRLIGRLEPVSYTHLRAHETVLDLVCRLLLEKKHEAPQ